VKVGDIQPGKICGYSNILGVHLDHLLTDSGKTYKMVYLLGKACGSRYFDQLYPKDILFSMPLGYSFTVSWDKKNVNLAEKMYRIKG